MLLVINVIFPIFALILLGYGVRRLGLFNESTTFELNRYVVWLALPAQLFQFTANGQWMADKEFWGFAIAFSIATFIVFSISLGITWRKTKNITKASFDGLSASYSNTGYMGIPLCILALGDDSIGAPLISTLVVVCGLFSISVALIEASMNVQKSWFEILRTILLALLKNPLILAPLLGIIWAQLGMKIFPPISQTISFLAVSASPCALISIGLFLAHKKLGANEPVASLVFTKLIIHPLLTWLIASQLLNLPIHWVKAALLMSALPTGTGPFMLAQYYQADGQTISRTVLITTIGSIITLSFIIWLM